MNNVLNIYTDGGSRGNPGPAAVGVVIRDSTGKILNSFGQVIGTATNNIAEYQAVIAALKWLIQNRRSGIQSINFYLDSQLVVNQLNGLWKLKNPILRQKLVEVRQLEAELRLNPLYIYIPRKQNAAADKMVNQALDQ